MNKTEKYISPSVLLREKQFQSILGNIYKESYYIMDSDYYEAYGLTEVKNYYFIVVNTLGHFDSVRKCFVKPKEIAVKEYKENVEKLRKFNFFISSYQVKEDNYREVLVFELPKVVIENEVQNTAKNFINGEYSKLWTPEQLAIMFTEVEGKSTFIEQRNDNTRSILGVLTKNKNYKGVFVELLKTKYGTELSIFDVNDNTELDLPVKDVDSHEEIMGDTTILFQVGIKNISDIKNPQTVTSEDLI